MLVSGVHLHRPSPRHHCTGPHRCARFGAHEMRKIGERCKYWARVSDLSIQALGSIDDSDESEKHSTTFQTDRAETSKSSREIVGQFQSYSPVMSLFDASSLFFLTLSVREFLVLILPVSQDELSRSAIAVRRCRTTAPNSVVACSH